MKEYIDRDEALEATRTMFTMSMCASLEECRAMNRARNIIEIAVEAIPAADVRPRWIPVSERLPEDLKFVLAVEDGTVFMAHCEHYYGEEEVYVEWHDTMYYPVSPTHWMLLPQPPKDD